MASHYNDHRSLQHSATTTNHQYVSVAATYIFTSVQSQLAPMLARVSVVDYRGSILLDTFVRPAHSVHSFRLLETDIQLSDIVNAPTFDQVQSQIVSLTTGKIIVGHSLWSFLSLLGLSHPALHTRDLALFTPFRRKLSSRRIVDLRTLVNVYMGRRMRPIGIENSLEDARACMDLFRSCEETFENLVASGIWPCDLPPASFLRYFT